MTTLLLNGSVAIDAGCLAAALALERQRRVGSVVLTHSHLDHTGTLPFFLDNVFGQHDGLDVHASEATIHALRRHMFNNASWPDFSRLPNHLMPVVRFLPFETEVAFRIGSLSFTPVEMNHVVETHGFLVEEGDSAFLWSSDTGPTDRFWEVANQTPHLKLVCIDVSFDDERQQVADDSGHLCPRTLATELDKLDRDVPVLIHHLKPAFIDTIRAQVKEMDRSRLDFLEQGRTYDL